ncbi:Isochorismatase-like protein [Lasiosphaeria ovina]|uniref:Isochorismatase-like protein n=1 Tax=Lasiosphaeria ovina TaxID=92902 RepID=A0AAE0KGK4_9PEZI|nr:Isochorismatase-like protein [Lasiosphaeria ovina]
MATPTALFVIDIQNDLATHPETKIPHADRVLAAADKILATARTMLAASRQPDAPPPALVVFVQHQERPDQGPLVKDTEPWRLVYEPRPDADEELLVSKTTGDTFESNPDLAAMLAASGVGEIVAFGVQSECCVESTCRGALTAGFGVTLLSGAHSTYDLGGKSAVDVEREVELRLRDCGVKVVPWQTVVAKWEGEGQF